MSPSLFWSTFESKLLDFDPLFLSGFSRYKVRCLPSSFDPLLIWKQCTKSGPKNGPKKGPSYSVTESQWSKGHSRIKFLRNFSRSNSFTYSGRRTFSFTEKSEFLNVFEDDFSFCVLESVNRSWNEGSSERSSCKYHLQPCLCHYFG